MLSDDVTPSFPIIGISRISGEKNPYIFLLLPFEYFAIFLYGTLQS